jgi:hypothetical protein
MPIIDPNGLFTGERLAACSDKAKMLWPFIYCASNGFARVEVNISRIRLNCFSTFKSPPADEDIVEAIEDYVNNFLVLLYEHKGTLWIQFDTSQKYLTRHKSKKDIASPSPTGEQR